jgi:hypothetical protein
LYDSTDELVNFEQFSELLRSIEASPFFLGNANELEHHRKTSRSVAIAFRTPVSETHCRERGFDRVRGPKMNPVLGGEVVERQQDVSVFRQALDCLGIFGSVFLHEGIEGGVGILTRLAIQISWRSFFAFSWRDFGSLFNTFAVL